MQISSPTGFPPLTGWKTIAEISKALGVQPHTICQAVARAGANGEPWVKQELMGRKRWLVDTDSEAYQYYEARWQRLATRDDAFALEEQEAPWDFVQEPDQSYGEVSFTVAEGQEVDITEYWPELCQSLQKYGLVVFVNGLEGEPEHGWQWQWGATSGNHCSNKKQAVLTALEEQLTQRFNPFSDQASEEPSLPKRRWF
jgi:hypothetical protein